MCRSEVKFCVFLAAPKFPDFWLLHTMGRNIFMLRDDSAAALLFEASLVECLDKLYIIDPRVTGAKRIV